MKEYAALKVLNDTYVLKNEQGKEILSGNLPKAHYIYEHSMVFNLLSKHGWDFEFKMDDKYWYMMSKEVNYKEG